MVRHLRGLRHVIGWNRIANAFVGNTKGGFQINNDGIWFSGNLGSYIERQCYLFGGYEQDQINLFLAMIPAARRRTMLDVGANIGTHCLRFSQAFDAVHAFECNPTILPLLERNLALNEAACVTLHPIGLGERPGELDLYAPVCVNGGLGTFTQTDQYDRPSVKLATVRVDAADNMVPAMINGPIDAIKCDVQGFELSVLRGARALIAEHQPIIWIELSDEVAKDGDAVQEMLEILPVGARFLRFADEIRFGVRHATLVATDPAALSGGDYVIVPDGA